MAIFSQTQVDRILDGRLHSPIQDVAGDDYTVGLPFTMPAGVDNDFVCNGNVRNFKSLPSHITNIWDTVLNKATFVDFDNTPEMVANVNFTLNPDVSAQGIATITVWVNETIPLVIKSINIPYKGTTERINGLLTFYTGDTVGFDVKNKGVIFTVSSSTNAVGYDPSIEMYRT